MTELQPKGPLEFIGNDEPGKHYTALKDITTGKKYHFPSVLDAKAFVDKFYKDPDIANLQYEIEKNKP